MNGQELKNLREELGLTQKQVADELGVVLRTVAGWETGSVIPKSKHAMLHKFFQDKRREWEDRAMDDFNEMQIIDAVIDNFDSLMKYDRFAQFIENIELKAQLKFVKDQAKKD